MRIDVVHHLCLVLLVSVIADRRIVPMERVPNLLVEPSLKTLFIPQSSNVIFSNDWNTLPSSIFTPTTSDSLRNVADKPAARLFLPFGTTANDEVQHSGPAPPISSFFMPSKFLPLSFSTLSPLLPIPLPPINPNANTSSSVRPINIDPEAIMNVPEIIQHWGYPVEVHQVLTSDGYILTLHRIPYGKENVNTTSPRPVVFLQHGLLCTSSIWLLNLPHQSAGFIFADKGFDVWLGNMRGNVYSKKHITLDSDSSDFWKFSWEEMAGFDLPAMIDYVLNKTNQESLYYVGHSQGSLTMLAKLSKDEAFAKKIRKFFMLAPVSRMSHVQGLFYYLGRLYEQFNLVYRLFGDNEFMSNNIFTRLLTNIICDQAVNNPLCENFIFSVSGPNSNQFNSSRIGIYLAHNPAGTSSRNMLHFAQMVRTKRMASFDRGREANIRWYGQAIPPEYDLTRIHCDSYLFYSDYDWLASAADVEEFLIPTLPTSSVKFARKLKEFNHNDFLWGLRARKEIYDPIANIIKLDNRRLVLEKTLASHHKNNVDTQMPSFTTSPMELVEHNNNSNNNNTISSNNNSDGNINSNSSNNKVNSDDDDGNDGDQSNQVVQNSSLPLL